MKDIPAFPCDLLDDDLLYVGQATGMTLRDYFAAKAMQALLTREVTLFYDPTACAGFAYRMADAMLEARDK